MSERKFKVILLGATNTGKTSIIRRYMCQEYQAAHYVTPLPVQSSKPISENGKPKCELAIWDTAGSEDWVSMNATVYRNTHAIIFVASYDEPDSLDDLTSTWLDRVDGYLRPDEYCSIIAMNKCDLPEESRCLTKQKLEEKAGRMGIEFMEVSAATPTNINELFAKVVELLDNKFPENKCSQNPEPKPDPGKGGCC